VWGLLLFFYLFFCFCLLRFTSQATVAVQSQAQALGNLHKAMLPLLDKHGPSIRHEKEIAPSQQQSQQPRSPPHPNKGKSRQKKGGSTSLAPTMPIAILHSPPLLEQAQQALVQCQSRVHVITELVATCLKRDCLEGLRVRESDGVELSGKEGQEECDTDVCLD
jgi:hypothetical protein